VLRSVRELQRASGAIKPRTTREFLAEVEALPGGLSEDLKAWFKGDPTVGSLAKILEGRRS
jgi:hypothetical protein